MIPIQGYENQRVAVLGLGRTGLTAAAALKAGGAEVVGWDDMAKARESAEAEGVVLSDLSRDRALEGLAALIVSPGIPHLYPAPHPVIDRALAAGVVVDNDIGLFFRSFATEDWDYYDVAPRVIAVTGSNGKSTTSALIHHILQDAGRPSQLAGNIGRGVLGLEPAPDGGVVVLELSSYQTELARALTPDVAVFLNLSPDHLDRHGGLGGYFAAKRRLFTEGGPDRAIIGVDEAEGRFLAGQLSGGPMDERVIRLSVGRKAPETGWHITLRKGFLSETRKGRQVASIDLRALTGLAGVHNHQNAGAAYAATRALGLAPRQIEAALASFEGLPHRSQFLGEKNGVRFINDSKATNVQSALMALGAHEKLRWIAGGLAKEGGIDALKPQFGRIKKAYLIGHSAEEFALTLGGVPHDLSGDMERAVAAAIADAEAGDTVLLAPAAASFDQYPDFEKRGDHFASLVRAHLDS